MTKTQNFVIVEHNDLTRRLSVAFHRGYTQDINARIADIYADTVATQASKDKNISDLLMIKGRNMIYTTLCLPAWNKLELGWTEYDTEEPFWSSYEVEPSISGNVRYTDLMFMSKLMSTIVTQVSKHRQGDNWFKDDSNHAYLDGLDGILALLQVLRNKRIKGFIPAKRVILPCGLSQIVECTWEELGSKDILHSTGPEQHNYTIGRVSFHDAESLCQQ